MAPGIPPLSFSSGPSRSGDAFAGAPNVTLGNFTKGIPVPVVVVGALLALLIIKKVK